MTGDQITTKDIINNNEEDIPNLEKERKFEGGSRATCAFWKKMYDHEEQEFEYPRKREKNALKVGIECDEKHRKKYNAEISSGARLKKLLGHAYINGEYRFIRTCVEFFQQYCRVCTLVLCLVSLDHSQSS